MITLDTSAVFALLNRRDPAHRQTRKILDDDPGPAIVPAGILGEITYLIEDRLGLRVLQAFLDDLESGAFAFDCGDRDWSRIKQLVRRYSNLPLGAADASVVACAERNQGAVLTLDRHDFSIVAREGTIKTVPA